MLRYEDRGLKGALYGVRENIEFKEVAPHIWYPVAGTAVDPIGKMGKRYVASEVSVNRNMADAEFDIAFPLHTQVTFDILRPFYTHVTDEKAHLKHTVPPPTMQDLETVADANVARAKELFAEQPEPPVGATPSAAMSSQGAASPQPSGTTSSFPLSLLIGCGIFAVLGVFLGTMLVLARRRKRGKGAVAEVKR